MDTAKKNNIKLKKKTVHIIIISILIFVFVALIGAFTVCNYLIHRVDDNIYFNVKPARWQVGEGVKRFILDGSITVSEDMINTHLQKAVKTATPLSDGAVIEALAMDISDKQNIYVRYNKNGKVKIICAETQICFNEANQSLEVDIDSIRIGKLKIPEFLYKWYMNKYFPYGDIYISSGKVIIPLSSVEALNGFDLNINVLNVDFSEQTANIRIEKPFKEERQLI